MSKEQAETKRANFHMPAALYAAMKVNAAQNGKTFRQEMVKAAQNSLKQPIGGLTPQTIGIIKKSAEIKGVDMNDYVMQLIINANKY